MTSNPSDNKHNANPAIAKTSITLSPPDASPRPGQTPRRFTRADYGLLVELAQDSRLVILTLEPESEP